ncbi:response regulator transcription factor [Bradymonas sediminis]|uniref:DNA-binding response regulator n=1 Tax=Bradymonas sediminis TaxID=1548548 RepID=A0A2Z4FPU8_9DELT|nr:response regulator transcription factor [Bradymonas sediminis]AWV91019.1 DNA-binding response regulator [Bradymonas sediminis]TDP75239.1 winged helix family two component transcriptional regulator [Bradymonas sediminis]
MTDQILLIEDDFALGDELFDSLDAEGYEVTWIKDGAEAYREAIEGYDLVVLDLMLPGKHGFDVLKKYRENSDVPVIILTARRETRDKLRGFELGSDDFMTKPFLPEELLARVRARLRRPVMRREADRELGPLSIDFDGRTVSVDGEPVELTAVEFDILAELARRPGMALSRRQLVERALPSESEATDRTLDVHISRIRKKLGVAGELVQTVWGIGYKLDNSKKRSR